MSRRPRFVAMHRATIEAVQVSSPMPCCARQRRPYSERRNFIRVWPETSSTRKPCAGNSIYDGFCVASQRPSGGDRRPCHRRLRLRDPGRTSRSCCRSKELVSRRQRVDNYHDEADCGFRVSHQILALSLSTCLWATSYRRACIGHQASKDAGC